MQQIVPLSILTREKFGEQVGLTAKTVYAMCDRGYLPVVRVGRRVFINLVALRKICENAQPFAVEAGSGRPQLCEDGASQRKAAPQASLGNTIRNRFSEAPKTASKAARA